MAPAAVSPERAPAQITIQSKDALPTPETQTHVHGAEDKTPLAAISHGILMDGEKALFHVAKYLYYMSYANSEQAFLNSLPTRSTASTFSSTWQPPSETSRERGSQKANRATSVCETQNMRTTFG
jgi:hypothetical protein